MMAWSGLTGRVREELRQDELLGGGVRPHVVDRVGVGRADLGVQQVVDEEVGGDRVLRPCRMTAASDPRTPPSSGSTYLTDGRVSWIVQTSPLQSWPTQMPFDLKSPMGSPL